MPLSGDRLFDTSSLGFAVAALAHDLGATVMATTLVA